MGKPLSFVGKLKKAFDNRGESDLGSNRSMKTREGPYAENLA